MKLTKQKVRDLNDLPCPNKQVEIPFNCDHSKMTYCCPARLTNGRWMNCGHLYCRDCGTTWDEGTHR